MEEFIGRVLKTTFVGIFYKSDSDQPTRFQVNILCPITGESCVVCGEPACLRRYLAFVSGLNRYLTIAQRFLTITGAHLSGLRPSPFSIVNHAGPTNPPRGRLLGVRAF